MRAKAGSWFLLGIVVICRRAALNAEFVGVVCDDIWVVVVSLETRLSLLTCRSGQSSSKVES